MKVLLSPFINLFIQNIDFSRKYYLSIFWLSYIYFLFSIVFLFFSSLYVGIFTIIVFLGTLILNIIKLTQIETN